MMKEALKLMKKGVRNPDRVLPFIRDQSIPALLSLYGRAYRAKSAAANQREQIYDFINTNDEFVLIVLDACRVAL